MPSAQCVNTSGKRKTINYKAIHFLPADYQIADLTTRFSYGSQMTRKYVKWQGNLKEGICRCS